MENFDILEFIMSKCLVVIPCLNILGYIIKQLIIIPNKYIPLILLAVGITACGLLTFDIAEGLIQGILTTGAAVLGHQIVSQVNQINNDSDQKKDD
jgi:hypothetical protein